MQNFLSVPNSHQYQWKPKDFVGWFIKDIFRYSPNIRSQNTTKFGNKSLRAFGANLWNTLPENIKSITSLLKFKEFIKKAWPGPKDKCSLWK